MMNVVVVGPMSSGCRLLKKIINECPGVTCWLDTNHGSVEYWELWENNLLIPVEAKVVVILRNKEATDASREAAWSNKPEYVSYEDSIEGINLKYSNALKIQYEDLCENPEREIKKIAEYLGVPVWRYSGAIDKDRNDKWLK